MKIALVYDVLYPEAIGGAEKTLWDIAVDLADAGHDVHLFCMQYWIGAKTIERQNVKLHGVCRKRPLYNKNGKRTFLQPLAYAAGLFKSLWKERSAGFDIVDSIAFPFFSLFSIWAWRLLIRRPPAWVVTWLEVWGRPSWRTYISNPVLAEIAVGIEKLAIRCGDSRVVISARQGVRMQELLGVSPTSVNVVPRGFHLPRNQHCLRSKARVLYSGRLLDYKNVQVVLRAWPEVKASVPEATLRIIGAGPTLPMLRALASTLSLNDSIEFLPPHPDADDALVELAEAAIVVQPSIREGQSVTVLEAMASKTPVIASAHPESAVSDLIESGVDGILVESWDNPKTWAAAINHLLMNSDYRSTLAAHAATKALAFDLSRVVRPRLEAHYRSAIFATQKPATDNPDEAITVPIVLQR